MVYSHLFSFNFQMLTDNLDEFKLVKSEEELPTIAKLPPDFQPIACKPTFFDISLNHIGTPLTFLLNFTPCMLWYVKILLLGSCALNFNFQI